MIFPRDPENLSVRPAAAPHGRMPAHATRESRQFAWESLSSVDRMKPRLKRQFLFELLIVGLVSLVTSAALVALLAIRR